MRIIDLYTCLFLMFFFFSCRENKKAFSYENTLVAKENIQAVLDSFVLKNNHKNYIYELYINKLDPHNYDLLLYAGEKSLTEKENDYHNQISVASVILHDKKIQIYSGIEHYFINPVKNNKYGEIKIDGTEQIIWAVKDSFNILTVYKIEGAYPFMPYPIKNNKNTFPPPVISD